MFLANKTSFLSRISTIPIYDSIAFSKSTGKRAKNFIIGQYNGKSVFAAEKVDGIEKFRGFCARFPPCGVYSPAEGGK
jgi:hypothetical protein